MVLTLYTKPDCHLCEQALRTLHEVIAEVLAETGMRAKGECLPASVETGMRAKGECLPASVETGMRAKGECLPASVETGMGAKGECLPASIELLVRDITTDASLHRAYFERIPVVTIDGEELFEFFVDPELLRERLESGR